MINFDNLSDPGNFLYFVGLVVLAIGALLYVIFTLPDPDEYDDKKRK